MVFKPSSTIRGNDEGCIRYIHTSAHIMLQNINLANGPVIEQENVTARSTQIDIRSI
jgi:hypothetical protein